MGSLVLIVLIIVAYWVFVAAMLKSKISIPAEVGWHEAGTGDGELPSPAEVDALDEIGQQLETMGYTSGRNLVRGAAPQRWWVRSFLDQKTSDQAFIMLSPSPMRTHRIVAFRADLEDGRRIFTQNADTPGMGVTLPGVATALPGVDVVLLHRAHRHVVGEAGGKIAARREAAGVDDMAADHAQTMKSLVDQRVMALHPDERAYRYTTFGAIGHVLRFAHPFTDIRRWSRQRRAEGLLAKVSGSSGDAGA